MTAGARTLTRPKRTSRTAAVNSQCLLSPGADGYSFKLLLSLFVQRGVSRTPPPGIPHCLPPSLTQSSGIRTHSKLWHAEKKKKASSHFFVLTPSSPPPPHSFPRNVVFFLCLSYLFEFPFSTQHATMPEEGRVNKKVKKTIQNKNDTHTTETPEKKKQKKERKKKKDPQIRLYDGELRSRDIKGVDIGGQSREGLLCSIGPTNTISKRERGERRTRGGEERRGRPT